MIADEYELLSVEEVPERNPFAQDELRTFVADSFPKIIDGRRFNLGTLVNDHLWNLDQPDVINLIVNCISYAIIRDEYREYVKQRK